MKEIMSAQCRSSSALFRYSLVLALSVGCGSNTSDAEQPSGTAGRGADVKSGSQSKGTGVAKFCNGLPADVNAPAEITMEIGDGPDAVRITAGRGQCAPTVPEPCVTFPTGSSLSVRLLSSSGVLFVSKLDAIPDGEEILAMALPNGNREPTLRVGGILSQYNCSDIDPMKDAAASAGASAGGAASAGASGAGGSSAGGSTAAAGAGGI
jgi:hypothetical protein